ncbi:MAG: ABC transporter ATP-binding protein [Candidatus Marinimicrobia bacterium]|nr:ABC transporter ATP-binding protein [Candidatus Neomarinimicrobiota bacterium]
MKKEVVLELKDIEVVYSSKEKEVKALEKVSFKVEKEDFVSIVGPSGCGKTTILKVIAGLINFTQGKIIKPKNFEIGYVFQEPTLLEWRKVIDNIALPLEIKSIDKEQRYRKVKELLKLVDLEGFEEVYPKDLSGGMKQRVAIARALIYDPKILLMDEPFGALDEPTRLKLNSEINRIWVKTNKTILFVTHNIQEAVFLSTKVIVLSKRPGKVKKIVKIDFPRKRDLELLDSKEYLEKVIEIRKIFGR